MATYIHELPDWPRFRWRSEPLIVPLAAARFLQGQLVGQAQSLGVETRREAAARLGIETMFDATERWDQPLTEDRLLAWRAALSPAERPGGEPQVLRAPAGPWRDDSAAPMHIVSGPMGIVHFEAPAATRLGGEMRQFLEWFNDDAATEPVLKAAQAHLWIVTIHPFDDGNGEIAGAITDMALARSEEGAPRLYGMSAQIREERDDYYRMLERTQLGTMDITSWVVWFVGCLTRAVESARGALSGVLANARHWDGMRDVPLNERQRLMINRLLAGVDGRLTTSAWALLAACSQDTALRDIRQLVERGVLVRGSGGGRSTSYALAER